MIKSKTYNNIKNDKNNQNNKRNKNYSPKNKTEFIVPQPKITLRDIVVKFKDFEEMFGFDGEYIILHTGVFTSNGKEIDLKVKPMAESDNMIIIETSDDFGIYLENHYSLKEASDMVLEKISKKKHKGLMGFDEKNWSITSCCELDLYPYDTWPIVEIVENICYSILDE